MSRTMSRTMGLNPLNQVNELNLTESEQMLLDLFVLIP